MLIEIIKDEFKQSGFVEKFIFEPIEYYNEDYKHEVPGILIKHVLLTDFCFFIAHLNDSEMRRPINPDVNYATVVTAVWTPYLEPMFQSHWINEHEFSASEIYNDDKSAVKAVLLVVREKIDLLN